MLTLVVLTPFTIQRMSLGQFTLNNSLSGGFKICFHIFLVSLIVSHHLATNLKWFHHTSFVEWLGKQTHLQLLTIAHCRAWCHLGLFVFKQKVSSLLFVFVGNWCHVVNTWPCVLLFSFKAKLTCIDLWMYWPYLAYFNGSISFVTGVSKQWRTKYQLETMMTIFYP